MKKYLISCILILSSIVSVNAQSVIEDWEGIYEGQMIIGFTNRANDSLMVKFELTPLEADSVWTYRLTFDSKTYGLIVKDYELHRVGNSTVDFELDEKDGIIIEMSLMNDCFYDMFEVMGSLYATTLRKTGDELLFDLFSSEKKEPRVTMPEKTDPEQEEIEVISYKPKLHQTVKLKRISKD